MRKHFFLKLSSRFPYCVFYLYFLKIKLCTEKKCHIVPLFARGIYFFLPTIWESYITRVPTYTIIGELWADAIYPWKLELLCTLSFTFIYEFPGTIHCILDIMFDCYSSSCLEDIVNWFCMITPWLECPFKNKMMLESSCPPIKHACSRLLAYISVSMLYSNGVFSKVQVGKN
jgi:hypothetical protein